MTRCQFAGKVGYVVQTFPTPSETFIVDEALEVTRAGINVSMLYIYAGSSPVVQPSVSRLLQTASTYQIVKGKISIIKALSILLLSSPVRTFSVLCSIPKLRHRRLFWAALPAAVWCRREKIQLLHAHFADINLIYTAAISGWLSIPYSVTTHRYDIFGDILEVQDAKRLFLAASAVVTVSEFNQRHMIDKYGLSRDSINIIHCGVDLSDFPLGTRLSSGGPLRIVVVGRLAPEKGHDILLEGLAIAKRRGVPFSLVLIGGGPLEHDLISLRDGLGLNEEVLFLGPQPTTVVKYHLYKSDVFVLASRSEGIPVSCMEALATGLPVIATRVCGLPELIESGVNGLLFESGSADQLAEAIAWMYRNPKDAVAMGRAGRAVVESGFRRSRCVCKLIDAWSGIFLNRAASQELTNE